MACRHRLTAGVFHPADESADLRRPARTCADRTLPTGSPPVVSPWSHAAGACALSG